ncbi:DUF1641 domain-containing protein [Paenibacillus sp. JCM 10914]|uniref:DUF1641 domain-containing protein n=1 Tax=Paenibacillus sp. JCM 10914 TaxID=1236974 RepID=UPI0003CC8D66|nr:DUF1641 domain-containing protein [Paenibacillus sp. JCM 10914]GAE08257.1 hypothetical protein JCM10914_4547 [Paenibacillus sp. JCM 10914]
MSETSQDHVAGNQEAAAAASRPDVLLEQLLKPEVQESLTTLVDNLPKLTEMLAFMTKAYDFGKSVATDPVLAEDTLASLSGFTKPVTETAKGVASAAIEAGDRIHAQGEQAQIGVFGLMKMLKDPQVQKGLRFAQAYLDVLNEREQQNKR